MNNIFLTGVSRGLGKCLLDALAGRADVRVIAVGRHFSEDVQAKAFACVPWDLSRFEAMPDLADVLPEDGSVTLVNNAGVAVPIGAVGTLDGAALVRAATVNFVSPMLLVNQLQELCGKRKQEGRLTIINISTGAANYPIAGWGAYCSTKAAMKMFLDVLAEDAKDCVRVIHVDPGVMDTGMQASIRAADFPRQAEFQGYKDQGRLRRPEDVAREIVEKYLSESI